MTGIFEGVGIALSSLRAHKMRAALTILGVAIAVTVVMVIGALISAPITMTTVTAIATPRIVKAARILCARNDDNAMPTPSKIPVMDYSCRSAVIGSSRAARDAG